MYLLIVSCLLMACSSNGETQKPVVNDGGEFSFVNFNEHLNYYLAVQAFAKTMEPNIMTCWLKCMDEFPTCLSINSGKKASADSSFKIWCELLSDDKFNASEKFNHNPSSNHYSIPNPCDKLKCSNGGKCRANYVNNTGECQCELGFVGDTCDERCDVTPLGMGDYRIPDSSLAASSSWNSQLHPTCGRLRRGWDDKCQGGWHARQSQVDEFLQAYLGNLTLISKVATQGRAPDSRQHTHQYVTSYGLDYSLDVSNWESYKENGTVKIFPGNSNLDGIVTHTLAERLVTRYVRFMVKTWRLAIVMRVELYGCV
ncbi:contactin-associated protein-like 2 isoform X3 [Nematostella vectensis]|uniref:contactin-associated protein-like 2 isoform X3 n=1 Tax=Nematostella vectensis TaxID=45351 RepID=UPI0020770D9A|nr:contactin-associated protein-like 2 isoform X3 [Nematostella vectensis]XP_048577797.1 contactin-associated protein-like 2 isoform X3 [Nematostella vectensis]